MNVGKKDLGAMAMLTAIQIRSFKEPGRYSDGEGLILNLMSPGRGSWMVRVQANGKRRDIGLGALADIGLGEAREAARKIRKDTRAGIDVLAERKKERIMVPTFQDAARQVHAEHKAAWKNGKHQAQWIATLEAYVFPSLGDRLVAEIEGPATVHGFRSAFRDWVAEETDYPGEVAEAALAHAIPNKVEAAYRRTDFLEKRKALMADWAAFCSPPGL